MASTTLEAFAEEQVLVPYRRRLRDPEPDAPPSTQSDAPPSALLVNAPNLEALALVAELLPLVDEAKKLIDERHAPATRRQYLVEWELFEAWCAKNELTALPAHHATVALYATHLATTPRRDRWKRVVEARGRSPRGIAVAVAAIRYWHQQEGRSSPTDHPSVRAVLEGVARRWATAPEAETAARAGAIGGPCARCDHVACARRRAVPKESCLYCDAVIAHDAHYAFGEGSLRRVAHATCHDGRVRGAKDPILPKELRGMVKAQDPEALAGTRNRALFLVNWAGAFRRSELADLTVEQVRFVEEGMLVALKKTKTNQKGQARPPKAIAREEQKSMCPVRALKAWLEVSGIKTGYIFLSVDRWGNLRQRLHPASVAAIVKRWAEEAGMDPRRVAGHSMRRGLATAAARDRRPLESIMRQLGHVDPKTTIGYIEEAGTFEGNAGAGLLSRKK